jgi:hypothetical protein
MFVLGSIALQDAGARGVVQVYRIFVKYSSPTFIILSCRSPPPQTAAATRKRTAFIWAAAARGSASLRRADAAQVCNNVGFVVADGLFECSFEIAARQIVSERW